MIKSVLSSSSSSSSSPLSLSISRVVVSRGGSTCINHPRALLTRPFAGIATDNIAATDQICELAASNLRFGPGSTAEVGQDLFHQYRCRRVVVFTDKTIAKLDCLSTVLTSLEENNVEYDIYDRVRVEPSDVSFQEAIGYLSNQDYDGVVALGGGSVIDTAKAANLYVCYPPAGDFYDYVNPPIGKGLPIPGQVKPLIALPTTAGTGSETTGVAIFDDSPRSCKTGIANRHLKPTLGIIDPHNTATLPSSVTKYSGLDVLCHAIESYTALPFNQRSKPTSSLFRPAYQGSNPISDVWSLFALKTCARWLPRAVSMPNNEEARAKMLLASSAAGLGFGNAGVHLAHGMSYPISSQVKSYHPESGYESVDHPLVPHGLSVIVGAPAVFRFTGQADLERHATCARILAESRLIRERENARGCDVEDAKKMDFGVETELRQLCRDEASDTGDWLAREIEMFCDALDVPMGLKNLGYTVDDIPSLVEGTVQQHRVTKISPRPVGEAELKELFLEAMF